ncbi:transporter substrate-binding domain-containing protein [Azospirillum sp. TSO22-1]|uniref:response regulator n=1 Tax=Azospirillum sp. TSO22-1 TaxID=716789 RepID=UPI0013049954|nr:transporter substrate-binding domain-containing protein [Azospirillum sp. TSO22-1]
MTACSIAWGLKLLSAGSVRNLAVRLVVTAGPSRMPVRVFAAAAKGILIAAAIVPPTLASFAALAAEPLIFYGDDNTPPYEFLDQGKPRGLNVDLLRAIGARLGRPVEIRLTTWTEAQTKVLEGTGHALTMLTPTPEREKVWGFSEPTHTLSFSLFMRTRDADRLRLAPLAGQRIGVQEKAFSENYFRTRHPDVPLVPSRDFIDGIRDLLNGKIDAFAQITASGAYALEELAIGGITVAEQPFATRAVSVPVPKSNPELLKQIDDALHDMKRDGTLERLIERWSPGRVHVFNERDIWLGAAIGGTVAGALFLLIAFVVASASRRRWRAEASLRESEGRFRAAFETAAHGMALVSSEGRFVKVNRSLCSMIGYSETELLATDFQTITHPEDLETDLKFVRDLLAARIQSYQLEKRYFHKSGSIIWILLSVALVRSDDGEPLHFVAQIQDITEQHTAKAALIEAKRRAEAAGQAKSEFLANMSHEIRTPMSAIIGLTQLLEDTSLGRQERDYVSKIRQSAQSLLGILNDVLDFSKVEAGHLELEHTAFSLDEVLRHIAVIVSANAHDKGIETVFAVDRDVPHALLGDPMRLEQVLINLAGNAVKFTETGEVIVSVRKRSEDGNGVMLAFSIRDTGIGIPRERQERLFQAFSQADSSTGRRYGGTGLGLAICSRLVALMGGSIDFTSEPGQGSEFRFTAAFGCAGREAAAAGRAPEDLGELSVLIVEDNAAAREAAAGTCRSFRWAVTTAASGPEGLDCLRRSFAQGAVPDALLVDWRMPGMDGIDMLRAAAADPAIRLPATILMITGFGVEDVSRALNGLRVDAILCKPATPSMILDAVARARLGGKPAAADTTVASRLAGRLDGMRLLLVEDNAINQEVAATILKRAGAIVDAVDSGEAAIAALQRAGGRFDAVLMDVQMPGMDGYEATRIVRRTMGMTALPVIAMTANAMDSDREQSRQAGMDAHIAKPIDVDELFGTLTALVQNRTGTASVLRH